MKTVKTLKHKAIIFTAGTLLSLGASGCESIYDKTQDCDPYYYLSFVYDMNMDYADAFSAKVNSVEVYAFDSETGELAGKFMDSGAALAQEGYKMRVDLQPGKSYDFIAWCGLENNEGHFKLSDNITTAEDILCRMDRQKSSDGSAFQNINLHPLFHGKVSAKFEDIPGDHVFNVPLIKDTNNINFSLQELSGEELDPERFSIKINIDNGLMNFDNTVLKDEGIEYYPYYQASGSASVDTKAEGDESKHDLVVAEMSTARLIASHNPMIQVIDNEKNKTVYSIPLVKWALMLKSQNYSSMGDQEYLDREDEYNVILYVNGNSESDIYIAASVMINSWRIVLNDTELH